MASSSSSLLFVFLFLAVLSPHAPNSRAASLPLHPRDVLPLLPRQIAWPVLSRLRGAVDLLPSFVGAASETSGDDTNLSWKGACFYNNTAWIEFHNKTGSEFGGGTVHMEVSKAHSWTCMDLYVFATPYRVTWDYYFLSREHTLEIKEWEGKAEFEYVKSRGVSIFLMEAGMLGTLQALWDVFPLFTNTGWGESSNIGFLKKHMGASFVQRPQPWVTNVSADEIHSGDFLAISKIRGRWGGFETLEKWVSGAYAGHTAVCLRDSEGKLWVGESGHENEQGEDIIAILPWDEWWEFELKKDDSNPHIALLPLHPDIRAKFNETAAWEYAKSVDGKPYGYHNMIFSWIDTIDGNYPPPLDAHLGLELPDILVETERRSSTFDELLTIPEQDDWLYTDGKSTSCVAFVLEVYKEAGLFDPIGDSIQVTEFTIKDAYSLRFFESNAERLPEWCKEGDDVKLPFCQIRGKYRMELPGYNTVDPYPHMNERCPSMPPKYSRPQGC
ncbi:hypothetical protein SAY87_012118 [Trapa incisa]|uniref:Uncharacterized protein n=1 Tax=Trapa incisa TaxID=236973 RepID=A0AAN7JBX8_9MYRT|nr:hypothetical protein SAY87_012118 [Trapa incisa]